MGLLGPELFFLIRELPVCLDVCHWHKENVRDSGGECLCGMHTDKVFSSMEVGVLVSHLMPFPLLWSCSQASSPAALRHP